MTNNGVDAKRPVACGVTAPLHVFNIHYNSTEINLACQSRDAAKHELIQALSGALSWRDAAKHELIQALSGALSVAPPWHEGLGALKVIIMIFATKSHEMQLIAFRWQLFAI